MVEDGVQFPEGPLLNSFNELWWDSEWCPNELANIGDKFGPELQRQPDLQDCLLLQIAIGGIGTTRREGLCSPEALGEIDEGSGSLPAEPVGILVLHPVRSGRLEANRHDGW